MYSHSSQPNSHFQQRRKPEKCFPFSPFTWFQADCFWCIQMCLWFSFLCQQEEEDDEAEGEKVVGINRQSCLPSVCHYFALLASNSLQNIQKIKWFLTQHGSNLHNARSTSHFKFYYLNKSKRVTYEMPACPSGGYHIERRLRHCRCSLQHETEDPFSLFSLLLVNLKNVCKVWRRKA